jgi:hypothetical protein
MREGLRELSCSPLGLGLEGEPARSVAQEVGRVETPTNAEKGSLFKDGLSAETRAKLALALPAMLAGLANVAVLVVSAPLFWVPAGAHVGTWGWAIFCLQMSGLGLLACLWAAYLVFSRRKYLLPLLGFALGLTPFPLARLLIDLAMYLRGVVPIP